MDVKGVLRNGSVFCVETGLGVGLEVLYLLNSLVVLLTRSMDDGRIVILENKGLTSYVSSYGKDVKAKIVTKAIRDGSIESSEIFVDV